MLFIVSSLIILEIIFLYDERYGPLFFPKGITIFLSAIYLSNPDFPKFCEMAPALCTAHEVATMYPMMLVPWDPVPRLRTLPRPGAFTPNSQLLQFSEAYLQAARTHVSYSHGELEGSENMFSQAALYWVGD